VQKPEDDLSALFLLHSSKIKFLDMSATELDTELFASAKFCIASEGRRASGD